MLYAENWDAAAAAQSLDCSTNQLIKLLKHTPVALQMLNARREQLGLKPLR